MTTGENRTAGGAEGPLLPIDERVIEALEADSLDAFQQSLGLATLSDAEEQRILFGMARRLRYLIAEAVALMQERDAIVSEFAEAIGRRQRAVAFLDQTFEAVVLDRREQGRGTTLTIRGVGEWTSRSVPGGWDLPTRKGEIDALMAWLKANDPDAYPTIVETAPRLNTTVLRAWLDADPDRDLPPGVSRRDERISVTYELRDE